MINVQCDGCKSPYQVDERRVPATGLKMRCSKCGNPILVQKSAAGADASGSNDLPSPAASRPKPSAPVLPRGAVMPKPLGPSMAKGPPSSKTAADSAEEAALMFARGEASSFNIQIPALDDDALGEVDLPSPVTLVSKEKPDVDDEEEYRRPSERPTAPHLPTVVLPRSDETRLAFPDEPPPPGKATVRQMPAVKPGDSFVDLPAVATARDIVDLPAPVYSARTNPAPRAASVVDLPAPARPPAKRTLEIELPENSLPSAAAAAAFGEIDFPATVPAHAAAKGFAPAGLAAPPPVRDPQRSFGEIDLPSVPSDLPVVSDNAFGEIDLPQPDMEVHPDAGFGEFDLPEPEGDASFGHLDLPLPPGNSGEHKLQIPASFKLAALPSVKVSAAPAKTSASGAFSGFGDLDLPLTSESSMNLNAVVLTQAAAAVAAPVAPSLDFALDELSLDAPASKPRSVGDANRGSMPSLPGEEFSLGGPTIDMPAPTPGPSKGMDITGGIGDEVELGAGGDPHAADAKKDKPSKVARPDAPAPPQPSRKERFRRRAMTMGAAVLFAVGGGSLSLLPDIGPFGVYAIMDIVQADDQTRTLKALENSVQTNLDEDTLAAAGRALNAAKAAQVKLPRHRATAAYTAYVAFIGSVRHGPRASDETFGKQMLEFVGEEGGRERLLALAGKHRAAGKNDAARRVAKDAVAANGKDIDALALMGEIELAAGSKDAALDVWKKAVAAREKSARALYGLARAEFLVGDLAGAEKSSRAAIAASPKHAGARILLATIIGRAPTTEAEAVEHLNKVTTEGEVRAAASEGQIVQAYIEAGRLHLFRSRVSAAAESYAAALKMDPRNIQALIGDAELFFRSGRNSQALLRFEEAMRADEASVLAKVGAIKTLLALERMKDAKDIAKKLRESKPEAGVGAYWLGRVEEALGNKKDAETLYMEAIKLGGADSEIVDAYVSVVALLSALGRGEDAQAKLAEASAKYPNLAALHRAKGEVLSQAGRYAEARTEFEAALAKEDDLGTRFRLGVTLRRMRAFDEAMAVLDKMTEVDKEFPGLALERGLLYQEMGQSERALEMYAAALAKAPNDVDLKMRVGSTQVIAGQADEAEKILREVLKDRAASADANHFLGRALLLKGGTTAEAIRFLDRATEIDANRAEYYLYVAWAANELNQVQRAEQAIARAMELDKELADAYWQRGILFHKQGRTLDALTDLQIALEKRPSRFEAYATMALCYQDQARWPDAQASWIKAIEGNGSVAEWHYRLGKIYESNGNRLQATPELEKAIELLEAKPGVSHPWHFDAYFLYGEAMRSAGQKDKALKGYRRYLQLAPLNNAYRIDAEKAIKALDPKTPLPR